MLSKPTYFCERTFKNWTWLTFLKLLYVNVLFFSFLSTDHLPQIKTSHNRPFTSTVVTITIRWKVCIKISHNKRHKSYIKMFRSYEVNKKGQNYVLGSSLNSSVTNCFYLLFVLQKVGQLWIKNKRVISPKALTCAKRPATFCFYKTIRKKEMTKLSTLVPSGPS